MKHWVAGLRSHCFAAGGEGLRQAVQRENSRYGWRDDGPRPRELSDVLRKLLDCKRLLERAREN